jgi:cell division protein FtsZ
MRPTSSNGSAHSPDADFRIKVIGVGGAGSNALDRLVIEGSVNVDLVACNTDVQALAGSVASQKIQLGRRVTRGLGAGGDPELGFSAAEEAAEEIRGILDGVPLVIVCAGLGGGTGSGAAPYIVRMAREQNSLVLVCATLPFSFEGRRRAQQAQESLGAVQQYADAVMCFENDRMGELNAAGSGIHDAFAAADQIISQSVRAIIDLVMRRGLIHLGFDDLLSALRSSDSRCLFGYGEASGGPERGQAALAEALRNPLMDQGALLGQSANVLVNIVGGEDLTLAEVQGVMEELARHIGEQTQLLRRRSDAGGQKGRDFDQLAGRARGRHRRGRSDSARAGGAASAGATGSGTRRARAGRSGARGADGSRAVRQERADDRGRRRSRCAHFHAQEHAREIAECSARAFFVAAVYDRRWR